MKRLTLVDIQKRRHQLAQEAEQDAQALQAGLLDHATAAGRNVRREAEQRWLDMEALLLEQKG